MPHFLLWDTENEREVTSCGAPTIADVCMLPGEGQEWHQMVNDSATHTMAVIDGQLVEIERPPNPNYALTIAKSARWQQAKAYREQRMAAGCATPHGRADSDPDSQRKVNGAVTAALVARMAGVPFQPMAWTMADNSVVEHDTDALVALGLAIGGHVDACQQAGTAIRAEIEAAETVEAVAAIDITAGYPA